MADTCGRARPDLGGGELTALMEQSNGSGGIVLCVDSPGEDLCTLLRVTLALSPSELVICDVAELRADLAAIDALMRLTLVARRHGAQLRLRHETADLRALLGLLGLDELLPAADSTG